jgi:hypothetical protein
MKSLSVRKIAAFAAGAAMLGAAFAAAAVDTAGLGNYPFFSNYEPNVKIVVGADAAASDAVAAANIAAMVGSLAYTKQDAVVQGTSGLSCGNATGGACTLTGKTVMLDVSTPSGSVAGQSFVLPKVYIGGYLDNDSSSQATARVSSFTSGNSLLTVAGRGVSHDDTTIVYKGTITDSTASKTYTEEERYYFGAEVNYSETDSGIVAQGIKAGYTINFTSPIPYCPGNATDINAPGATVSAGCGVSVGGPTQNHKVKMKFLGDDWVITNIDLRTANPSVTIGREEPDSPKTLKIGESVTTLAGATISVTNLMTGYGSNTVTAVALSVVKPDGTDACTASGATCILTTGDELTVTIGTSNLLVVKADQVVAGIGENNYAKLSWYSKKMTLTNGQSVDSSDNQNWIVTIDAANTTTGIQGGGVGNAIKRIYLENLNPLETVSKLLPGQQITVVKNPVAMNLSFDGLDTSGVNYDTLTFTIEQGRVFQYSATMSDTANVLRVTSTRDAAFTIAGNAVKEFFAVYDNASITATGYTYTPASGIIKLYYRPSTTSSYYNNVTSAGGVAATITYNYGGDDTATMSFYGGYSANSTNAELIIPEVTYPSTTANQQLDLLVFSANNSMPSDTIKYGTSGVGGYLNRKVNFVTQRGVKVTSISATSQMLNYPHKVVQATFTLKKPSAPVAGGVATTGALTEGQEYDLGAGYKVKINTISATGTGGAGGDVTGTSELTCNPASALVINTGLDTATTPLVVTDAEAAAVTNAIVVGGPAVNTLAADLASEADVVPITTSPGQWVVKVVGGKVLVAGYSAADTQAAANALIGWLKENRDSITRS